MKKKLFASMMACALCAVTLTAGCANKEEKQAQEAAAATAEAIEETVNAGVEDLEVPESTGDMSAIVGNWTVNYMVDDENNDMTLDEYAESIGVDPATLETTYVFSDDGSFSLILAGIETKGVWSVDEDDVVSITMPTGSMGMLYVSDTDVLYLYDDNSGMTTYLARE